MPVIHGPRFRKRDSAIPPLNRVLAGKRIIWNMNTGQQHGTSFSNVFDTNSADPAVREKTWDALHTGPPYLSGGPFDSIKIVRPQWNVQGHGEFLQNSWYQQGAGLKYRYDGGFYDPIWVPSLDPNSETVYTNLGTVFNSLYPDLASIGSGAYDRLRPELSKAGLGQAIAEMRDLPRMLSGTARGFHTIWNSLRSTKNHSDFYKTRARMLPKGASNHFVNTQFGWIPFLSDLGNLFNVYQNAPRLKAQISRDNGRWIKRRRVDKHIESRVQVYARTDVPGVQPTGSVGFDIYDTSSYNYTITRVETTDVWYEGSWKYYRPEFDWDSERSKGPIAALQREMAIHGAQINPTLIWKVTPWSWLADWFSNAGDAIERAQDWATDSLVSKYMYLMHHRTYGFELRARFNTNSGGSRDLVWHRSADVKRRQSASSPFSFSLSGDLTARQLAILGALGIARS